MNPCGHGLLTMLKLVWIQKNLIRSEVDAPDPLCSGQTRDRRLGRSSAKTRRSPTPPLPEAPPGTGQLPPPEPEYPDPADLMDPLISPTHPQEVLLINRSGFKGGKRFKGKRQLNQQPCNPPHQTLIIFI